MGSRGTLWALLACLIASVAVNLYLAKALTGVIRELDHRGSSAPVPPPTAAPTPAVTDGPALSPAPSPTASADQLGDGVATSPARKDARVGDMVMVGRDGVDSVVVALEGPSACTVRIRYRNRTSKPLRPDVEVALLGEVGERVAGLRVSWWLSVLGPGQASETYHRLSVSSASVSRVSVVKPDESEDAGEVEGAFLRPGTWGYHGKEILWVTEFPEPVQILDEVRPLLREESVFVPFDELVAEFVQDQGVWLFASQRQNAGPEGVIPLNKGADESPFMSGWTLVRLRGQSDLTGWVKSEQVMGFLDITGPGR